jgi:hypothetical protein
VGVSPLQFVNLHRNRRYFVIKLHTWFCLSYFLKTNKQCYCIYQYFMSINSLCKTVSVSGYRRPITNETTHVTTHATHSDPLPTIARSTSLFLICCLTTMYVWPSYFYSSEVLTLSLYYCSSFSHFIFTSCNKWENVHSALNPLKSTSVDCILRIVWCFSQYV